MEDQRDAADRKRVECVRQIRALEAELQSVRAKHTAELEHMAEVKKLWKVRGAVCCRECVRSCRLRATGCAGRRRLTVLQRTPAQGVVDTLKAENQNLVKEHEQLKRHNANLQQRLQDVQAGAVARAAAYGGGGGPRPLRMGIPAPSRVPASGAEAGGMNGTSYVVAPQGYGNYAAPPANAYASAPGPRGGPGAGLKLPAGMLPGGPHVPASGSGAPSATAIASAQAAANSSLAAAGVPPLREDAFADDPMGDTLPGGFSMTALGLPPDLMATIPPPSAIGGDGGGGSLGMTGGSGGGGADDPLQGQIDQLSARMAQETQRTIERMQQLQAAGMQWLTRGS